MASLLSISLLFLVFSNYLQISSSRKVELKNKDAKLEPILHPQDETSSIKFDPSKVIQLSWHPRTFLYNGFLSDEECDYLISKARGMLEKSLVNGSYTGNGTFSAGIVFTRGHDEIISKIEERISAWTFLPKENGEDIQISLYRVNESHVPYYDNYGEGTKLVNSGNRVATVMMYLSSVIHGGETVFPKSELKDTQAKDDTWSDCAATGYAVKSVKGDALLFFNFHPNMTVDESSLHGSCMVHEGEKWFVTKWIQTRAFNAAKHPKSSVTSDVECIDEDENCSHWAAKGECQRNPVFMLGSPDYYGTCRKSCGAC